MNFLVSVITPVYKAESFLEQAVESCVHLQEVGEVILVEDGSPDNSLILAQELNKKYEKVKLYRHPNGKNKGAGASRNLGIGMAQHSFIAFLDADDWYLPNRFKECKKLFEEHSDIDYVFGISQLDVDYVEKNNKYKQMFLSKKNHDVFENMLTSSAGYFDTNSITIKKERLFQLGQWFNPCLKLHQDSELWLRIAYHLKGKADTKVKPGAIARRHPGNRITTRNSESAAKFWEAIHLYFKGKELTPKQRKIIDFYYKYYQKQKSKVRPSYWSKLYLILNVIRFRYL